MARRRLGARGRRRRRRERVPGRTSAQPSATRGGGGPARRGFSVAVRVCGLPFPLPPGGGQAAPPPTPTAPGLPGLRPNPWFPWRRPEVEARRDVHATRARGLSGPRRPLRPPSRTGSGSELPGAERARSGFQRGWSPSGRKELPSRWPRERTCAGARGLFGRFSRGWRSLPAERMFPAFRCFPC